MEITCRQDTRKLDRKEHRPVLRTPRPTPFQRVEGVLRVLDSGAWGRSRTQRPCASLREILAGQKQGRDSQIVSTFYSPRVFNVHSTIIHRLLHS
jgi:hypothetical protein